MPTAAGGSAGELFEQFRHRHAPTYQACGLLVGNADKHRAWHAEQAYMPHVVNDIRSQGKPHGPNPTRKKPRVTR